MFKVIIGILLSFGVLSQAQPYENPALESALQLRFSRLASGGSPLVSSLTHEQLSKVYKSTIQHRVASLEQLAKYDKDGIIGFCFGRAMTAHLMCRQLGLDNESIKKLFIIGSLCSECKKSDDKPEWRFHLTTIVLGEDGEWYAIDPVVYKGGHFNPLKVSEWISEVREGWDSFNGKEIQAKLYVTSSSAVIPQLSVLIDPEPGDKIIHLKFIPEDHGINADGNWKSTFGLPESNSETIYSLDESQSAEYFSNTGTNVNGFQFLGVTINGSPISYKNYFKDLLKTNLKPKNAADEEPK